MAILFLTLQSRSSSDNSSTNNNNNADDSLLLRRWYPVSWTNNGKTYYPSNCTPNKDNWKFELPNKLTQEFYTTGSNCVLSSEPYTWTKNRKTIKLYYGGKLSDEAVIEELSATSLRIVITSAR
jgi:hypothetical protein